MKRLVAWIMMSIVLTLGLGACADQRTNQNSPDHMATGFVGALFENPFDKK